MSGPSCWTPLGPACVLDSAQTGQVSSGAFRALAFDPRDPTGKTIYAAAASGGIWKSADEGLTWTPIGDAMPTTSVGVLAVGTTPDQGETVLLAGTGDVRPIVGLPGEGPVISRDGGAHWDDIQTLPGPPLQRPRIHAAAMVSGVSEQMWLATESGLLWASGGQSTWAAAVRGDGSTPLLPWTAVVVTDGAVLAAAGGQGTSHAADGVYRLPLDDSAPKVVTLITGTPDALPSSGSSSRIALAVAPSDKRVVYAAFMDFIGVVKSLFRSSDGGLTWNRRTPPPWAGFRDDPEPFGLVVHPTDPDRVYLVTMNVGCSFDGGATAEGWEALSISPRQPRPAALAFSPAVPHHAWLATGEGLFFSASEAARVRGGDQEPWQARNRGLAALSIDAVAQHPTERSILLAAGVDRGVLRYRNHPLWETVAAGRAGGVAIDALAPTTWYATLFTVTVFGTSRIFTKVLQSKDAGKTWKEIADDIDVGDRFGMFPLALDPSNRGIAYFGTTSVYRRDDAHPELGWVKIATPARTMTIGALTSAPVSPISAIAVAPSDPKTVYVGTDGGALFRLAFDDANKTWAVVAPTQQPPGNVLGGISSIAVSFQDARKVYATMGTPRLPGRNGNQVGVEHRLWASADGGDHWTSVPIDIPDPHVFFHKVIVHPDDDRHAYLATDESVFAGGPDPIVGQSWRKVTDNLPRAPVSDLLIFPPGPAGSSDPPARVLRAATFGRGVWERALAEIDAGQPPGDCQGTDVYVRDSLLDTGRGPTPADVEDPLRPGKHRRSTDAIDIKTQAFDDDGAFGAFANNVPYLPEDDATADPDFIGFQLMGRDPVQAGQETHVFLQAHNRGPATVTMAARVLFAPASVDAALPADPFGNIAATEPWQPIGDKLEASVRPAEPTVFVWRSWHAPAGLKDHVKLVGVIATSAEPLTMPSAPIEQVAPANKQVLFRTSKVVPVQTGFFRWWMIPVALGAAAGVAAALVWRGDIASFFRSLTGGGGNKSEGG